MCVVRLCLQYQAVAALCRLARGAILGGPWGAVLGGAPLMAEISVYARLGEMRPNLRPATYWKLWTLVGGKPFEPFEPFEPLTAPPGKFREGLERACHQESGMCVVRLCLQYQGRGGPLQIGTGGHIRGPWGAVLGGAPLMADISLYARPRGMRPILRPATYWKLWTSVGGKAF